MAFRGINMSQPLYVGNYRAGGSPVFTGPINDVFLMPFNLHVNGTFTTVSVTVQTAVGNHEMAVYDSLFRQLGTCGVTGQSSNQANIGPLLLPPGLY